MYRLNIAPKPTPRPRVRNIIKNGKRINLTYYPTDYVKYKESVCLMLKSLNIEPNDYTILHVTYGIPYPKTVKGGKKERIEGKKHLQRPDLDNFGKGFVDFLTQSGVFKTDDSFICEIHTAKVWTNTEGYIIFMLEE
jgi:Holliday junction resolvase RusA-like endonuclease